MYVKLFKALLFIKKEKTMSVEFWAEFFQSAGFEPVVAASYANVFFVNKIRPSHLLDIDREALKEMGISAMGDILTILRYVKFVHRIVTSSATVSTNEKEPYCHGSFQSPSEQLRNADDNKGKNQFANTASQTNIISEMSPLHVQTVTSSVQPSINCTQVVPSTASVSHLASSVATMSTAVLKMSPDSVLNAVAVTSPVPETSILKKVPIQEECDSQSVDTSDCNLKQIVENINKTETEVDAFSDVLNDDRHESSQSSEDYTLVSNDENSAFQQSLPIKPHVPSELVNNNNNNNNGALAVSFTPPVLSVKQNSGRHYIDSETTDANTASNKCWKEVTVAPGSNVYDQKHAVFHRLGQQAIVQTQQKKKSVFLRLGRKQDWRNSELNVETVPQSNFGLLRRNLLMKKPLENSLLGDTVNNQVSEPENIMAKDSGLPLKRHLLTRKTDSSGANKLGTSCHLLSSDYQMPKNCTSIDLNLSRSVSNGSFNKTNTSAQDGNFTFQDENNKEPYSVQKQEVYNLLSSKIPLYRQMEAKTSLPVASSVNPSHMKTVVREPGETIYRICSPPSSSSPPSPEDFLVEKLADPKHTHHSASFYVAWANRRKLAYSFPGIKPSFLKR